MTPFDAAYKGRPSIIIRSSGGFEFWYKGSPVASVRVGGDVPPLKTFTCRAFIVPEGTSLAHLNIRANILSVGHRTLTIRASLRTITDLSARARMARRQGWPIPDVLDPGANLFQPTQLSSRGRIQQPTPRSTSIGSLAAIFKGGTHTFASRAKIVKQQHFTIRAAIRPRKYTVDLLMQYEVRTGRQAELVMLFYTVGERTHRTVGMGARIVAVQQTQMGLGFAPRITWVRNAAPTVQIGATSLQILQVGAQIQRL